MTSEPTPLTSEPTSVNSEPTPENTRSGVSRRRLLTWGAAGLIGVGAVSAVGVGLSQRTVGSAATGGASAGASTTGGFLSSTRLHTLSLTIPEGDLATMLATYTASGEKTWLKVTVTIDGSTYDNVGIRLKGNSSLRQLLGGQGGMPGRAAPNSTTAPSTSLTPAPATATAATTPPQNLPWLVRLNKYAAKQNHEGLHELVVRSNTTATALNEAVALDLLTLSGLESQKAAYGSFSVNGSSPVLRLTVENPAEDWATRVFTGSGTLFKADAEGDYSYRGSDASAYAQAWDLEAGTEDWAPLVSFLDFVNNATDTDFKSGLAARLDTAKFAKYLAFESLINNFDDVDGPGNNSLLWWSTSKSSMTLLAWDHNLAFGTMNGMGGQQGQQPGARPSGAVQPGARPSGAMPSQMPQGGMPTGMPQGGMPPDGIPQGGMPPGATGPQGGMGGKANALATRFTAAHAADITDAKTSLTQTLLTSGSAKTSLATWSKLVTASGLVGADTVTSEAAAISAYLG